LKFEPSLPAYDASPNDCVIAGVAAVLNARYRTERVLRNGDDEPQHTMFIGKSMTKTKKMALAASCALALGMVSAAAKAESGCSACFPTCNTAKVHFLLA
jgi:hypothetical protein